MIDRARFKVGPMHAHVHTYNPGTERNSLDDCVFKKNEAVFTLILSSFIGFLFALF